jgi:hypothetical protein
LCTNKHGMNDYSEQVNNIQTHIIDKCNNSQIISDPYPHMVIDNFFPSDITRKIDSLFPDINHVVFDSVTENKKRKRYRRSFFSDDPNKPPLEHILDNVFDKRLLMVFLEKFNKTYNENYVWGAHYAWDYNSNGHSALAPHVDTASKILSFVYYVPMLSVESGKPKVQAMPGTDILIQNQDGTFFEHTCVEAKRNRCLVFEKSTKSWHAVKETKTPRRTITLFIIDKRINEAAEMSFKYVK